MDVHVLAPTMIGYLVHEVQRFTTTGLPVRPKGWDTRPVRPGRLYDPVGGLHAAIEELILFGFRNPNIYLHISKPRPGQLRTIWRRQVEDLGAAVREMANAGLLKVGQRQSVDFILPFLRGNDFHRSARNKPSQRWDMACLASNNATAEKRRWKHHAGS